MACIEVVSSKRKPDISWILNEPMPNDIGNIGHKANSVFYVLYQMDQYFNTMTT